MAFTITQAELIGASLETMGFAIYLVLFPVAIYILITRKTTQKKSRIANMALVIGGSFLCCLITAHWILTQLRLWVAFIDDANKEGGALRLFGLLGDPRNVIRTIAFVLEVIILDTLMVYRVYIIWNQDWRVLTLPMMVFTGEIVASIVGTIKYANAPPYVNLWDLEAVKWIVAGFSLTLITNILALGLISARIISRDRRMKSSGARRLSPVMLIMVESAGIYCSLNAITLITLVAKSPSEAGIITFSSPMTGISFCLITIRVGFGQSFERLKHARSMLSTITDRPTPTCRDRAIPMHIHITRQQETSDKESGYASHEQICEGDQTQSESDGVKV